MATNTTRYGLRKPDTTDSVNITTDIATPYDTIDTNLARVDDAVLGTEITRWNRGLSGVGTVYTTSGSTELNMPKLSISSINIVLGRTYHFSGHLYADGTTDGDFFNVLVRRTTALTGPTLLAVPVHITLPTPGFAVNFKFDGHWVATSNNASDSLHVSVARAAGSSGIANIQGSGTGDGRNSQFNVTVDPPSITNTVES